MSANISNAYVEFFDAQVHIKYQDKGNLLRGTTRSRSNVVGDTVKYPVYGGAVASPRAYASNVTPMSPSVNQVSLTMQDWEASDYTDIFTQQKVNFDEITELAQIAAMAIGRTHDQMIINALTASGTANTIPDGGDNLTFEKCLQVNQYFNGIGVPHGDRYMIISASGEASLLQSDRITNNFFVNNMVLQNGTIDGQSLLGLKFIVIPDFTHAGQTFGLPKVGDIRTCYAFHREAIGFAAGIDQRTDINYIPEKLSWLVSVIFSANAVAIDALGIVSIACDETA